MEKTWSGEEWEEWCLLLIRQHYGADQVQVVPATHLGDLGIEAFTHTGCAFQCYAAQEPLSTNDRYIDQRDKLTRDLNKLEKHKTDLIKLLGNIKIETYFFLVPIFTSRLLVQHASTKAEEYRKKNLEHLGNSFKIIVTTDEVYSDAQNLLLKYPRKLIDVSPPTPEDVKAWITANEVAVRKATEKLQPILPDPSRLDNVLEGLITQYTHVENALDKLRRKYPETWERTKRYQNEKERLLVLEYPDFSGGTSTLSSIAKEISAEIINDVPALDRQLATTISWASIADWLMRCPLQIPKKEDRHDSG